MLPNLLSILRIPLGIAFVFAEIPLRLVFTLAAAISDGLDGYLARRFNLTSKLGTLLDPLGDKCFALLAFGSLYSEGTLSLGLLLSLFSREVALVLYSALLKATGVWKTYTIKAFFFGKVMTTFQFFLLIALLFNLPCPDFLPYLFWALGFFCFLELTSQLKNYFLIK